MLLSPAHCIAVGRQERSGSGPCLASGRPCSLPCSSRDRSRHNSVDQRHCRRFDFGVCSTAWHCRRRLLPRGWYMIAESISDSTRKAARGQCWKLGEHYRHHFDPPLSWELSLVSYELERIHRAGRCRCSERRDSFRRISCGVGCTGHKRGLCGVARLHRWSRWSRSRILASSVQPGGCRRSLFCLVWRMEGRWGWEVVMCGRPVYSG